MLQSVGLQRVRHNLLTEHQQNTSHMNPDIRKPKSFIKHEWQNNFRLRNLHKKLLFKRAWWPSTQQKHRWGAVLRSGLCFGPKWTLCGLEALLGLQDTSLLHLVKETWLRLTCLASSTPTKITLFLPVYPSILQVSASVSPRLGSWNRTVEKNSQADILWRNYTG